MLIIFDNKQNSLLNTACLPKFVIIELQNQVSLFQRQNSLLEYIIKVHPMQFFDTTGP